VAAPPIPGLMVELDSYAGKVRALAIVWFIYGAIALTFDIMGLAFANAFFAGRLPWMHGPWGHGGVPPLFMGPMFLHFIWPLVAIRAILALAAGWGLLHRTEWGRVVAIVAAFFSLFKPLFGTALGIWTLVVLMGYRNTTLYEQLPEY
jgi:hypothetical protein